MPEILDRKLYSSDLCDTECGLIEPNRRGDPPKPSPMAYSELQRLLVTLTLAANWI